MPNIAPIGRDYLGPGFRSNVFVEAQIFNVTTADIDFIGLHQPPGAVLRQALEQSGIEWRVLTNRTLAAEGSAAERASAIERTNQELEYLRSASPFTRQYDESLEAQLSGDLRALRDSTKEIGEQADISESAVKRLVERAGKTYGAPANPEGAQPNPRPDATRGHGADPLLELISDVNPLRNENNCAECTIVTDLRIDGRTNMVAAPSETGRTGGSDIPFIAAHYQTTFQPVRNLTAVEHELLDGDHLARGIIAYYDHSQLDENNQPTAHAMNVVNDHGTIRYLDGQHGHDVTAEMRALGHRLTVPDNQIDGHQPTIDAHFIRTDGQYTGFQRGARYIRNADPNRPIVRGTGPADHEPSPAAAPETSPHSESETAGQDRELPPEQLREQAKQLVAQGRPEAAVRLIQEQKFATKVFRWVSANVKDDRTARDITDQACVTAVDRLGKIGTRDVEEWVLHNARILMAEHGKFLHFRQRIWALFVAPTDIDEHGPTSRALAAADRKTIDDHIHVALRPDQRKKIRQLWPTQPGARTTQPQRPTYAETRDLALRKAIRTLATAIAEAAGIDTVAEANEQAAQAVPASNTNTETPADERLPSVHELTQDRPRLEQLRQQRDELRAQLAQFGGAALEPFTRRRLEQFQIKLWDRRRASAELSSETELAIRSAENFMALDALVTATDECLRVTESPVGESSESTTSHEFRYRSLMSAEEFDALPPAEKHRIAKDELSEGVVDFPDDAAAAAYIRNHSKLAELQTATVSSVNQYLSTPPDHRAPDDPARPQVTRLDTALVSRRLRDAVWMSLPIELDDVDSANPSSMRGAMHTVPVYWQGEIVSTPSPRHQGPIVAHARAPRGAPALGTEPTTEASKTVNARDKRLVITRAFVDKGQVQVYGYLLPDEGEGWAGEYIPDPAARSSPSTAGGSEAVPVAEPDPELPRTSPANDVAEAAGVLPTVVHALLAGRPVDPADEQLIQQQAAELGYRVPGPRTQAAVAWVANVTGSTVSNVKNDGRVGEEVARAIRAAARVVDYRLPELPVWCAVAADADVDVLEVLAAVKGILPEGESLRRVWVAAERRGLPLPQRPAAGALPDAELPVATAEEVAQAAGAHDTEVRKVVFRQEPVQQPQELLILAAAVQLRWPGMPAALRNVLAQPDAIADEASVSLETIPPVLNGRQSALSGDGLKVLNAIQRLAYPHRRRSAPLGTLGMLGMLSLLMAEAGSGGHGAGAVPAAGDRTQQRPVEGESGDGSTPWAALKRLVGNGFRQTSEAPPADMPTEADIDAIEQEILDRPQFLAVEDPDPTDAEIRLADQAIAKLKNYLGPDATLLSLTVPVDPDRLIEESWDRATKVSQWWHALTDGERAAIIAVHPHQIGNADGVLYAARDVANRRSITRDINRFLERRPTGRRFLRRTLSKQEHQQLLNLVMTLRQLAAIVDDVRDIGSPPVQLIAYDATAYDGNGSITVSIDDADGASIVSRHLGGLGTTLRTLGKRAKSVLAQHKNSLRHAPEATQAAIIDIGYHHPTAVDEVRASILAEQGGDVVAAGIVAYDATRTAAAAQPGGAAAPQLRNLVAHSYGSTTLCFAGRDSRLADYFDQVILVASPGAGPMDSADDFGIGDNVYALADDRDPVTKAGGETPEPDNRYFGFSHGRNPAGPWGAIRLNAAAPPELRDVIRIHQSYFSYSDPENQVPSTALNNIALVCAGLAALAERVPHRPADTGPGRLRDLIWWRTANTVADDNDAAIDLGADPPAPPSQPAPSGSAQLAAELLGHGFTYIADLLEPPPASRGAGPGSIARNSAHGSSPGWQSGVLG